MWGENMKFESEGLKQETLTKMNEGLLNIKDCIELVNETSTDVSKLDVDFKITNCLHAIEDAEDKMKKMYTTIQYTIDLFEKNEKANIQIIDKIFNLNGDYFNEIFGDEEYSYGVAQQYIWYKFFDDLYNKNYDDSKVIKNVAKQFNMTYEESAQACTMLDSIGACSYAATANEILYAYRYDPVAFEKDFGYPMFVIGDDDNLVVNSEMLLMDLYMYYNLEENGGHLFSKDKQGRVQVNDEYIEKDSTEAPVYTITGGLEYPDVGGVRIQLPNEKLGVEGKVSNGIGPADKFLKSKNASKCIEGEKVCCGSKDSTYDYKDEMDQFEDGSKEKLIFPENKEELKNTITGNLDEDTSIYFTIDNHNDVILQNLDEDYTQTFEGDHAMIVTDANDDGIYVTSWGGKFFITYDDLMENGTYRFVMCTASDV